MILDFFKVAIYMAYLNNNTILTDGTDTYHSSTGSTAISLSP